MRMAYTKGGGVNPQSFVLIIPIFTFLAVFSNIINPCDGSRILFFIGGISSHSHRSAIQPLANKLAERGHSVTFLSPIENPESHPNITDFAPAELKAYSTAFLEYFGVQGLATRMKRKFANEFLEGTGVMDVSYHSCSVIFNSQETKNWAAKEKFDLIIIDTAANECAYALVHYFKSKSIIFGSITAVMPWDPDSFGFPAESSWVPTLDNFYEGDMGFYERWVNTLSTIYWNWKYLSYHLPRLDQLVRDAFGVTDMPPLIDMVKKTDLMFLNQYPSDSFSRSYPPFVIPVGGMHVDTSHKPLPAEIEQFIEGAGDEGFIYVSFGTIIKISTIPAETLQVFFDAFAKSKQRFLWKWENTRPANAPQNIYFKPWFPQQEVLAHPKIKGYIMQGGQISTQQAICNGVPLIMFPINGDQDIAAKKLRSSRNGIEMELYNLTAAYLGETIEKIVYDPSYSQKSKQLAKICSDRITPPLDTAVWWTEYVLRTDDTSHLKPLSIHQSWWVYRGLDIYAVFFFAAFLGLVAFFAFIVAAASKVYNRIFRPTLTSNRSKSKVKRS